jgi:hypothetical protein
VSTPCIPAVPPDEPSDDDKSWEIAYEAKEDAAPLIPEGEYPARVVAPPKVRRLFDSQRLVLTFEIVQSKYVGTRVEFIAEVRTGKHARFREAWEVANGGPAKRHDRMALRVFKNRLFLVSIRTVTKNRFQRKRALPYSIVDTILERMA